MNRDVANTAETELVGEEFGKAPNLPSLEPQHQGIPKFENSDAVYAFPVASTPIRRSL